MPHPGIAYLKLIAGVLIFISLAVLAHVFGIAPLQADDPPGRVGVVVSYGNGQTDKLCAEFPADDLESQEVNGFEVLQQSGLEIAYDDNFDGNNVAICGINGKGCPGYDCLCQCAPGRPAEECLRWTVWRLIDNKWQPLRQSIAYYHPQPDEVHAWVWGNGDLGGLPPVNVAEACNLPAMPTSTATSPATHASPLPGGTATSSGNGSGSEGDNDGGGNDNDNDNDNDDDIPDLSGLKEAIQTQVAGDQANATGTAAAATAGSMSTSTAQATTTGLAPATELALLATPTLLPTPPPTASATQTTTPEPTSTPLPLDLNFSVDANSLLPGQCTTLRWDMKNSDGPYLEGEKLPPQGSRQICPTSTHTYNLSLFYGGKWLNLPFTLKVSPPTVTSTASPSPQPPGTIPLNEGTPIAELFTPVPGAIQRTPDSSLQQRLQELSDEINPTISTSIGCIPLAAAFGVLIIGIGGMALRRWLKSG